MEIIDIVSSKVFIKKFLTPIYIITILVIFANNSKQKKEMEFTPSLSFLVKIHEKPFKSMWYYQITNVT